jgi:hypothetical protein
LHRRREPLGVLVLQRHAQAAQCAPRGNIASHRASRFIDTGVRDTMQRVVPKFPDAHSAEVEPVAPLDLRELMKRRFGGT